MTTLLILLASVLTGIAIYNLSCAFVDVPTAATSKMMLLAKNRQVQAMTNCFMSM